MPDSSTFRSKDRIDYPEVLFRHIDRLAECAVKTPAQLPIAVDILAALVAFKGKINYEANEWDTPEQKYIKTIKALEEVILLLDKNDLLFRYKQQGKVGNVPEDDKTGGETG